MLMGRNRGARYAAFPQILFSAQTFSLFFVFVFFFSSVGVEWVQTSGVWVGSRDLGWVSAG